MLIGRGGIAPQIGPSRGADPGTLGADAIGARVAPLMAKTPPAITGSSDEASNFMESSNRVGSGFDERSCPLGRS